MILGPTSGSSRYSPEYVALVGWLSVLFFGGAGLLWTAKLLKPRQLVLTTEGFQILAFNRGAIRPWHEIERFFIVEVRRTKIVSYVVKPDAKSAAENIAALRMSGEKADGSLPRLLTLGPEEVYELVEDWRHRHSGQT